MGKPFNRFALLLVILSIVYALFSIPEIISIVNQPSAMPDRSTSTFVQSYMSRNLWGVVRSTVYSSGLLLGVGVLIELVDRVLWNLSNPEKLNS